MTDFSTALLSLLTRFKRVEERQEAAQALAKWLDCESVLLLVHDPEVGALLPAPGFPQTVRAGRSWRTFLQRCAEGPGRQNADVELPPGTWRRAEALRSEGLALVLLDGCPDAERVTQLQQLLPLLALGLRAEQQAQAMTAIASAAQAEARRTHELVKALEAARAQAAQLNADLRAEQQRKDEFLAMLAHELRNPLTPLVNSVELLRRRGHDPVAVERQLDVMGRQVHQLSRLVEDLLDMSRISRGRIELRRETLALQQVLQHAVEASRAFLDGRRHQLQMELSDEPLWVLADSVRLTQVFSNLLHNAAKYTDPGGELKLKVEAEQGYAVVQVFDTGVGIDPEVLPYIFNLFTQAPVAIDRAQGGLGIGLTLVKSLVELHGGSVTAHSAGRGRGSCFTVRLPLTAAPAVPAPIRISDATARAHELQVLIIDDNEDAADSLAAMIRLLGHHVQVAYSGLDALQRSVDVALDLVLLDIGLPEMDGYEVGRRMRRLTSRRARFVALTGYGSEEDRRRSYEAGFDEHLVKPIGLDQLQALLVRTAAEQGSRQRDERPAMN